MSSANLGRTKFDSGVDSIKSLLADSAGTLLTSELVGGTKQSLHVAVSSSVLPTGAATEATLASVLSELQSITFAEDAAHASGDAGIQVLGVRNDAGTALAGTDGDYIPFSMTSTGRLRVDALVDFAGDYAEDSAHVSGDTGLFTLAVRNSALADLTSADGDYSAFAVDAKGRQFIAGSYAEDAAHSSGDIGVFSLSVRGDTTAALAGTSGDYAPFITWSNGDLKVVDQLNLANLQAKVSVANTATLLPASALANRKELFIQNVGSNSIFVGSATVTASGATQGIEVPKSGFIRVNAGPAQAIYGITASGTNDVIVWELS